jgi:hypothetical protein
MLPKESGQQQLWCPTDKYVRKVCKILIKTLQAAGTEAVLSLAAWAALQQQKCCIGQGTKAGIALVTVTGF